jgi:nitronate monooxygenase
MTTQQSSASSNRLTSLLGIEAPVVLGPFGGVSSVVLTAAVSDGGGLGSFGLYGYDGAAIRKTAAELRAATGKPFALNLWVPNGTETNAVPQEDFERYTAALKPYFEELGIPLPDMPARYMPDYGEQVEAVLEARPAVVSFVFGVPAPEVVEEAHRRGIKVALAPPPPLPKRWRWRQAALTRWWPAAWSPAATGCPS